MVVVRFQRDPFIEVQAGFQEPAEQLGYNENARQTHKHGLAELAHGGAEDQVKDCGRDDTG